ncbi:hypothetical protein BBR47_19250 [Brevibacillus brevis NBRC 100599]|uniref:Uncharacterized protein n=1 Tax=Brevibacillus brevis (strain 47 / JCM 6285 / NBRC 100599) TaxID=358681 RepID=C0ZAU3_BREBN|nr:hypothetical protein BBR47_19250 [Brevibacillus brevis NBRC 100599]
MEKQPATKEDIQRLIDILENRIPHTERLAPKFTPNQSPVSMHSQFTRAAKFPLTSY